LAAAKNSKNNKQSIKTTKAKLEKSSAASQLKTKARKKRQRGWEEEGGDGKVERKRSCSRDKKNLGAPKKKQKAKMREKHGEKEE